MTLLHDGYALGPDDSRLWRLLPPGHTPPTPSRLLLNCVINSRHTLWCAQPQIAPLTEGLTDDDQWLRMRERGSFIYIDEPLSF